MSKLFVPIETADLLWRGNLPFSVEYDDLYYSAGSGIGQSRHVFVDGNDLIERFKELNDSSVFTIAETGFGTGLNFLLTWQLWEHYAPKSATLHFISCEKHPLKPYDLERCLLNWPELVGHSNLLIENYPVLTPGNHLIHFNDKRVNLNLMLGDVIECYEQLLVCGKSDLESELRPAFVDAWYLDGFSPSKNERMWSETLIQIIAMLSKPGTTLATYTSAALIKSTLSKSGFVIEKRKGFGPKRHMTTAVLKEFPVCKARTLHTPWHINKPVFRGKSAIIVGAGLAGCFLANCLARRGWNISIIDELNGAGQGASANEQAVLFPKLSAYKSPLTQFMLLAFLYAHQRYKSLLLKYPIGELKGSLLIAHNEKERNAQQSLKHWLEFYPELGALVDSDTASELAGIPINNSGLFISDSGWVNSPELCEILLNHPNISLYTGVNTKHLSYKNEAWHVGGIDAPVVILASGHKTNSFHQCRYLPMKAIRGQMTSILATKESCGLKIPLCGDGHVLPMRGDRHQLGATYNLGVNEVKLYAHDDAINRSKLANLIPSVHWSDTVVDHWCGIRATTPDYLPLVGPIVHDEDFVKLYANLETNSKRWIPEAADYYPGLYVISGFGSRGLTTIPICAEWLASLINGEVGCLPRNLIQALSPSRFLRRNIARGKYGQ